MTLAPFITCAVTGGGDTAGLHPGLPVTPAQIAESAIEAARAGELVERLGGRVAGPAEARGRLGLD